MRLRTLLAATVASALTLGAASVPALATTIADPAGAGTPVAWGDTASPGGQLYGAPAIAIPEDLTGPVVSVAATIKATGVVTLDGHVRAWGAPEAAEWEQIPSGITDAAAISLANNHGAVLHRDGRVTAWGPIDLGPAPISSVPVDLRAKAIAVAGGASAGTGYAVRRDGTLAFWGDPPAVAPPAGLTNLVDISIGSLGHFLALHADGTITTWGLETAGPVVDNVPDFGGKKVVKIATGASRSGVVFEDGTIEIWGSGSLPADEPAFDGLTPAGTVVNLGLWNATAAVAVTADGGVKAWGSSAAIKNIPAELTGEPVSGLALGQYHAAVFVTAFRDLTKPAIAGQPKVGQTLAATPATFSLAPDAPATGQWYAGAAPIAGKTATTLAVDPSLVGKAISYRTTATRGDETVVSASSATAPVAPATTPPPPPAPKADAEVSAKAKASGKTKKIAKKVTITIAVKTSPKGISTTGKVKVTLKGKTKKTITVKVNAKGKATATFKKVKRGKYTATLKYAGNAKVKADTGKAKFRV